MAFKKNLRKIVLSLVLIGFGVCFLIDSFKIVQTKNELKDSISEKKETKKSLVAKKKELEQEKKNYTNPEYIEYIARGKYLVTKDGEQVFVFPSNDEDE